MSPSHVPVRCILFSFQEFSRAFFSSNFASSLLILFVAVGPSASLSSSSSLLGIACFSASRLSRESPWPEFPSAASLKNGRPSHRSACPPSRVPGSSPGWLSRPPEASATCPKETIRSPDGRSHRYRRHPLLQIPSLRFAPGNLAGNPGRRGNIDQSYNWLLRYGFNISIRAILRNVAGRAGYPVN